MYVYLNVYRTTTFNNLNEQYLMEFKTKKKLLKKSSFSILILKIKSF